MAAKPFASGHILAAADVNDLTGVINRSPTAVDIVSTTSFTILYTATIAAGALSTDRTARLTLGGDVLQNATAVPTFVVTLGATTLWQAAVGWSNDADRRAWSMTLNLQNINSASVQWMDGVFMLGDPTAGTVGIGSTFAGNDQLSFGGTAAENTAVAKALSIQVGWDVSSANASFRRRRATLELL